MARIVVIDTNVLISSIFWQRGSSHKIVELAIEQKINNFTSPNMLEELVNVLKVDFEQPEEFIQGQLTLAAAYSKVTTPKINVQAVKDDPKDDMVVECALSCAAQFIITWDNHLLKLKQFKGIKIVTPKEFINLADI